MYAIRSYYVEVGGAVLEMPGGEGAGLGVVAVGEGNAGVGGDAGGGGDAGHDFELHSYNFV